MRLSNYKMPWQSLQENLIGTVSEEPGILYGMPVQVLSFGRARWVGPVLEVGEDLARPMQTSQSRKEPMRVSRYSLMPVIKYQLPSIGLLLHIKHT